jgi:predicted Zn finger-like uncharacterized protein
MAVVIACPTCQQKVRVNENLLGKSVKCPQCKNPFTAVDPNAVQANASSWEPTPSSDLDFSSQLPPPPPPRPEEFDEPTAADPAAIPRKAGRSALVDYLLFRRMVTPAVIIVLFYIGVVVLVISGIVWAISGLFVLFNRSAFGILIILGAFLLTLLGILILRIYCEVVTVLFRILDNLRQINEKTSQGPV